MYLENKSKYEAQKRYKNKVYERITLQERREYCIIRRIEKAAEAKGVSKNAYIICAIERALEADGYPRPNKEGC